MNYLGKPFLPRELSARIEAVLRRRSAAPAGTPIAEGGEVIFGENVLDLSARTLVKNGTPLVITSGEFSLLAAFVQHPHRPLSRERLIELARGPESETDSRSMDVQVSRVRKLVDRTRPDPTALRADGLGIRLCVCPRRNPTHTLTCAVASPGSR